MPVVSRKSLFRCARAPFFPPPPPTPLPCLSLTIYAFRIKDGYLNPFSCVPFCLQTHRPVALDASFTPFVPPQKGTSPAPLPAPTSAVTADSYISPTVTRATLAVFLSSLLRAKAGTVRTELTTFIVSLLNDTYLPALPASSDANCADALRSACYGQGFILDPTTAQLAHLDLQGHPTQSDAGRLVPSDQTISFPQGVHLSFPGLLPAENAVLGSAPWAAAAWLSLLGRGWTSAQMMAEAALGVGLEAFGAPVDRLEAGLFEASRAVTPAAVAADVRAILTGSSLVADRKHGCGNREGVMEAALGLGAVRDAATPVVALAKRVREASYYPGAHVLPSSQPVLTFAGALVRNLRWTRDRLTALVEVSERNEKATDAVATAGGSNSGPVMEAVRAYIASTEGKCKEIQAEIARCVTTSTVTEIEGVGSAPLLPAVAVAWATAALNSDAAAVELAAGADACRTKLGCADDVDLVTASAEQRGTGKKPKKGVPYMGFGSAAVATLMERHVVEHQPRAGEIPEASSSSTSSSLPRGPDRLAKWASDLSLASPLALRLAAEIRATVYANLGVRKPKVVKGARDFMPDQMTIRDKAFGIITDVFKRHGAVAIDTHVFELRETLTGKYGEDSKLIYDLADQGGELLSLRYDLTVPFARFVALHGVGSIKRYHLARVYRRDQPQMNRGRFREFFQCDFDIAGSFPSMVADAEVVAVMAEIIHRLDLGPFQIKLSHRRLLSCLTALAGVPADKFKPVCSAVDKLDKESWATVRDELLEKGISGDVADRLWSFVQIKGEPQATLEVLRASPLAGHPDGAAALEELETLFSYLDKLDDTGSVKLDLSLARGLDYYTGIIYECVLLGGGGESVGSIAAGGRYDGLVGMFSGKDVPAVGCSIGIERVFAIMEAQARRRAEETGVPIRESCTQVLVASIGKGHLPKRMEVAAMLWRGGIAAEFGYKPNPPLPEQLGTALKGGVPCMVIFGNDELEKGTVKVKDLAAEVELEVPERELVETLRRIIAEKGW